MWKIKKTTELYAHPRMTLLEDDVILPDGTETKFLKIKDKGDAVGIIGIREDGKVCLTKEYFHPTSEDIYVFPGGFVNNNEEPTETAAKREFLEETGYEIDNLKHIASLYAYPRRLREMQQIFVGQIGKFIGLEFQEKEEESIKVFWFTEDEIDKMVENDEIKNTHTLAHWLMYKAKKKNL